MIVPLNLDQYKTEVNHEIGDLSRAVFDRESQTRREDHKKIQQKKGSYIFR